MSVNGKVIPHTPLAVDFWQVRKCRGTRLFFLSHMHSDHTSGLTSTWSDRPIYCSPTTATLLRLKLQVKDQWIHPLELGVPHLLPLDDIHKERLTVTLLDANHCPGAVMFLFEGYFGSILYTGDFRYKPSMLREPCLRTNTTIDVLYLDNTNCDPNRILPSRHQATQQIKEIIRSHPNHNVVIGLYTLGKETLLVDLAMEFKTWIEVSFDRMETLKALDLPDVFTTDTGAGRIRVVEQSAIRLSSLNQWNKEYPTLAILPTSRPIVSFDPDVHVVPYSDHSSYQELEDFVSALKPTFIVPITNNYVPESISALLPSKKRHEILVPESVQHYMLKQPESTLSSSAYTSLCRRHFRPLAPRGVIFESPVRGSRKLCQESWEAASLGASEDEMDIESSEKESDCILIDLNKEFNSNKDRGGTGDMWSLNIVETLSEEMSAESLPLSKLSNMNLAPVKFPTNRNPCSQTVRTTKKPPETNTKKINENVFNENHNQHCISGRNTEDNHTFSDCDRMDQHSGRGIDQEDVMSDNDVNQHDGRISGQTDYERLLQKSQDSNSCTSWGSLIEVQQECIEELERSILKDLPFTEEDFKADGLLQISVMKHYSLSPLSNDSEDDISDA